MSFFNPIRSQFRRLEKVFRDDPALDLRYAAGLMHVSPEKVPRSIQIMIDRMYFTRVDQRWDEEINGVARDTTTGFYNVFDFDVSVALSTKLYGFYTPLKKLFPNSKVEKFRHVITPNISFSYHPNFEKPGWGYYGSYDEPVIKDEDTTYIHRVYSRFPLGNAPRGLSANLSFGVANNLEMKIVNKDDTTGKQPYKVVSLIDNFSVTGGYNFAADSMNWNLFQVNLCLKFPKLNNYSLNLNTSLDPYMYELDAAGKPHRTNKQYWHNGRFPHWSGLRWSFSYTISNHTIKKWKDAIAKRRGEKVSSSPSSDSGGGSERWITIRRKTRMWMTATCAQKSHGACPSITACPMSREAPLTTKRCITT